MPGHVTAGPCGPRTLRAVLSRGPPPRRLGLGSHQLPLLPAPRAPCSGPRCGPCYGPLLACGDPIVPGVQALPLPRGPPFIHLMGPVRSVSGVSVPQALVGCRMCSGTRRGGGGPFSCRTAGDPSPPYSLPASPSHCSGLALQVPSLATKPQTPSPSALHPPAHPSRAGSPWRFLYCRGHPSFQTLLLLSAGSPAA